MGRLTLDGERFVHWIESPVYEKHSIREISLKNNRKILRDRTLPYTPLVVDSEIRNK